ncbi:MAG: AAA family ATPase [Actinomycetota bacterium]|nr:MoxR family ATPase [Actinomycetota bacterium]
MDRRAAVEALQRLVANVETVITAKREVIEASVLALAAEGHLLIEDAPGVGKTMLAKSIARSIDASFKRVQATPDLLPSDITGVAIFDQVSKEFQFIPGPIFSNVVVLDEINRTTPRTQAALLEAMEEKHVTAEGMTRPVPSPFFVIATQNPLEYHGTYPLPEGQLDRFLIATSMGYPDSISERGIVEAQLLEHPIDRLNPVISLNDIEEIQQRVRETTIDSILIDYVIQIVAATRSHPGVTLGAGPRGSLGLTRVAQARALLLGRDYVLPDDIKAVAPMVLGHRIVMDPQLRSGPMAGRSLISAILDRTAVPTVPALR